MEHEPGLVTCHREGRSLATEEWDGVLPDEGVGKDVRLSGCRAGRRHLQLEDPQSSPGPLRNKTADMAPWEASKRD